MRRLFTRDIPPGAAVAIVALVLLASVVTGGEKVPAAYVVPAQEEARAPSAAAADDLDITKIIRSRREPGAQDLFALPAPEPPPQSAAEVKLATPPAPVAPPLPFSYLGRLKNGDRVIVYVLRNQEMLLAEAGAVLESNYQVERISDTAVHFVYLPLGIKQDLTIPAGP